MRRCYRSCVERPWRTVAAVASEMTEERLHEALAAWNTADAERVLAFWSDDCVYHASFGPELMGRTFAGREEAREGIQQFFDRYPDGEFADTEVMVAGDPRRRRMDVPRDERRRPSRSRFAAATCSSSTAT